MLQNSEKQDRAAVIREDGRRGDGSFTARDEGAAEDTRMDLDPLPNWTLDEYRCECADVMDVKRLDSVAVESQNLVVYDRNCFERHTAFGAWKRLWAVLSGWCTGIVVGTLFADMPFVRCEQELSYCRHPRDTIVTSTDVAKGIRSYCVGFSRSHIPTCT